MKTADYEYRLPDEAIAQTPVEPRDSARLLVLDRKDGSMQHVVFREIGRFLTPGDLLVLNGTRVIPARLLGRKIPTGGKVELLLLRRRNYQEWEALVGGKRVYPGLQLEIKEKLRAEIVEDLGGASRLVRFSDPIHHRLRELGEIPLPPYIYHPLADSERYQTVFGKISGSVAAPTAGLHFTEDLIQRLQEIGIGVITLTLHIGLDTFAPVTTEDPSHHPVHREWCEVDEEAVDAIRRAQDVGGRVIAVGTTSVRALESAALHGGRGETITAFQGYTDLFILPGHEFQIVDAMVTNFHLPRSTLLMLVSAFADRDMILQAYQVALHEGYRFYSFGDAMLIL